MENAELPDLHEIMWKAANEGRISAEDIARYLLVSLVWMHLLLKHTEVHEAARTLTEWARDSFEGFFPNERMADDWRPQVEAGNLDAMPPTMKASPEYLAWIAANVKITVPDFVDEAVLQ